MIDQNDCDISGDCQTRKPVWKKWKERAEKAEARVKELEAKYVDEPLCMWCGRAARDVGNIYAPHGPRYLVGDPPVCLQCATERRYADERDELKARVAELEPPDDHVAVILPREDAQWWADYHVGGSQHHRQIREALRKALGGQG